MKTWIFKIIYQGQTVTEHEFLVLFFEILLWKHHWRTNIAAKTRISKTTRILWTNNVINMPPKSRLEIRLAIIFLKDHHSFICGYFKSKFLKALRVITHKYCSRASGATKRWPFNNLFSRIKRSLNVKF